MRESLPFRAAKVCARRSAALHCPRRHRNGARATPIYSALWTGNFRSAEIRLCRPYCAIRVEPAQATEKPHLDFGSFTAPKTNSRRRRRTSRWRRPSVSNLLTQCVYFERALLGSLCDSRKIRTNRTIFSAVNSKLSCRPASQSLGQRLTRHFESGSCAEREGNCLSAPAPIIFARIFCTRVATSIRRRRTVPPPRALCLPRGRPVGHP